MFESRHQPLLSRPDFMRRLGQAGGIALLVVCGALAIGTCGYHFIEHLPWIDAVLNAAMILSGMGPVDQLHTTVGKLFAAAYALFSGFVFLSVAAILFAPVFHRVLHRFHIQTLDEQGGAGPG